MVQWFPGHMAKTKRLITENIKLVDVVLELADARLPASSRNPLLDDIIINKPKVLVLTREDLADPEKTAEWLKHFEGVGLSAIPIDALHGKGTARNRLLQGIREQAQGVIEKRKKKGIIKTVVRTMVVGIPNVGKSTLINFLAGSKAAETGNKPGVTRGKQWIKIGRDVELLDMPGILWPKIEDPEVGYKLAATGAVGERALDVGDIARWLIEWLCVNIPGRILQRYGVDEELSVEEIITRISKRRGFVRSGGIIETEKGALVLLEEFRNGKLGTVTMDEIRRGV